MGAIVLIGRDGVAARAREARPRCPAALERVHKWGAWPPARPIPAPHSARLHDVPMARRRTPVTWRVHLRGPQVVADPAATRDALRRICDLALEAAARAEQDVRRPDAVPPGGQS